MLYLYQSNRLETLGEFFAAMLKAAPIANIFAAETVIVQSQGMKRWLNLTLAKANGIVANMDFVLPASFAWQLMRKSVKNAPTQSPFSPEVLLWRIFALLPTLQEEVFSPLNRYLNANSNAQNSAFELAGKIADIYDQYLVYRPHWLQAWEENKALNLGYDEPWQAELWRRLNQNNSALHRASLLKQTLRSLSAQSLPERITLFGISSLAPSYLALIKRLSDLTDICLFTLNPCQEYWGDIVSGQIQAKRETRGDNSSTQGHPLLATLGKQGRDFFDLISADSELHSHELYQANDNCTLLQRLQNDILNLRSPDENPKPQNKNDSSIALHIAHGKMRELEILKDQLLARFADDPTLTPDNVAVLMPDIQSYAPFIHAVFGGKNSTNNIPYSIADCSLGQEHPLLSAFVNLLDLIDGRFIAKDILTLLDCPALCRRFAFSDAELSIINRWIKNSGIRWARDAKQHEELGFNQDAAYSWRQGLDRLLLGTMLPAELLNDKNPLFAGLLPLDVAENADLLARFATLFDLLAELAIVYKQPTNAANWIQRLQQACDSLFAPDTQDHAALILLQQTLAELINHAELADYQQEFDLSIVRDWLKMRLNLSADSGFLNGKVSFCAMVPMRSLPFRLLCLIGLNHDSYPRNTKTISFDLIAKNPERGDRSRREDDRYLFLEALLSARDAIYLSYIGRSLHNNEALPPSTLISELIDTLSKMGADTKCLFTEHPLQAFSRRYYDKNNPRLFSFDSTYFAALQSEKQDGKIFGSILANTVSNTNIFWDDFLRFWRLPASAWLKQQLGLQVIEEQSAQENNEPFNLDGQAQNKIAKAWIDCRLKGRSANILEQQLNASAILPSGSLGASYNQQMQKLANSLYLPEALQQKILPPQNFQINLAEFNLTGHLSGLRQAGLFILSPTVLSANKKIAAWLNHLIISALQLAEITPQTTLIDPSRNTVLKTLCANEAQQILITWLKYWKIGQSKPLPFFATTSLAAAEKLKQDPQGSKAALNTAYAIWSPVFIAENQYVESENLALKLAFRQQDPLKDELFLELATDLLIPILNNIGK